MNRVEWDCGGGGRFEQICLAKVGAARSVEGRFGNGWIAQLVEQRIENPRVVGSIPSPATPSLQRRRGGFGSMGLRVYGSTPKFGEGWVAG